MFALEDAKVAAILLVIIHVILIVQQDVENLVKEAAVILVQDVKVNVKLDVKHLVLIVVV